ncbi:unnamed protein product, partial [Rotaria sordida]
VDGASFPQQFLSTKSNYTSEAIAAAVAKNSDTSNSLKPNGEHFLTRKNRGRAQQSNR